MKRLFPAAVLAMITLAHAQDQQVEEGFTPIFNGKTWAGWSGPTSEYQIADGGLSCFPGKGGTIFTTREYADFVARMEINLPPG